MVKDNGINFNVDEILAIGDDINAFNDVAKYDPQVLNMKELIKLHAVDVESGIRLIMDVSKNILVEGIALSKGMIFVFFI